MFQPLRDMSTLYETYLFKSEQITEFQDLIDIRNDYLRVGSLQKLSLAVQLYGCLLK